MNSSIFSRASRKADRGSDVFGVKLDVPGSGRRLPGLGYFLFVPEIAASPN
jgi:hypothetical protein